MKTIDIGVVRIYITEASGLLDKIVNHLKKEIGIRGISVFRAIGGFGESGDHTAALLDLSLNLPLVLEFFDDNKIKIDKALEYLTSIVKLEHIIIWDAKTNA